MCSSFATPFCFFLKAIAFDTNLFNSSPLRINRVKLCKSRGNLMIKRLKDHIFLTTKKREPSFECHSLPHSSWSPLSSPSIFCYLFSFAPRKGPFQRFQHLLQHAFNTLMNQTSGVFEQVVQHFCLLKACSIKFKLVHFHSTSIQHFLC